MAPSPRARSCVFVVGAAITLSLFGCEGATEALHAHVTNFIASVCHTAVEKIALKAQEVYEQQVFEKCAKLRETAESQLLNDEKGAALEQKCLDAGGVLVDKDAEDQQNNFTQQCIDSLQNASQSNWGAVTTLVQDFIQQANFSTHLSGLIDEHLGEQMKQFTEQAKEEEEAAKTEAGDDDDDETTLATTEEPETTKAGDARLYNSAVHIPRTVGAGYAALTCLFGALASAVGLAVVVRRGVRSREPGHESLVDPESEDA